MPQNNDRSDKFTWTGNELIVDNKITVPSSLEAVIDKMPDDDEKAILYLQKQVKNKRISLDEFRLILQKSA